MKDIRIFVASSKELVRERDALAFLVLSKEEEFAARGLRVRLAKWEYVDPRMTEARTEDRYLDEMYDCDAAFVLFRNIAGMYTREELDKALAAEKAGTVRLKAHEILFDAAGAPDSDAARLRASLPEGAYGVWSGPDELRTRFLALVDRVAAMDGLRDAPSDANVRKITAFLAADEELADERDAFADTVLNVNDLLEQAHRNMRIVLRFYDPARAEGVVESSEMGLVLYGTTCRMFGRDEIERTYARVKDGSQNPKRFYVFFHDLDESREKALDAAFRTFRDEFVSKLGHFVCQFGDANALRLSFLLSLERYAGETIEIYSTAEVPEPGRPFVGREKELRRLCELLEPVPGKFPAGRLPVITGAGGTGKSELVRQYASQLRVQYPGGVFQVDMEHARTWDDVFLGILKRIPNNNGVKVKDYLGLKDEEGGGERPQEPLSGADVRDALLRKAREFGPMLLVLDNVEGCLPLLGPAGDFRKAFPAGMSERVRVNVVATARMCDIVLRPMDWAVEVPLGDLSEEDALTLLLGERPQADATECEAAGRVAKLLGCRALYLKAVPALLDNVYSPYSQSFVCLEEALKESLLETVGEGMEASVDEGRTPSALWKMTRKTLAAHPGGGEWIRLAQIASFFSPDGFPAHVLRYLWGAFAAPGRNTDRFFNQALLVLGKHGLLAGSEESLAMHRLMRAAILADLGDEKSALEEAIGKALADCLAASQDIWISLAEFPDIVRNVPDTIANGRFYARLLSENPELEELCSWEKFGGHDWALLLAKRPQFADKCQWDKLDGWGWAFLLKSQPQFSNGCAWDKLEGLAWASLLAKQQQFLSICAWDKLNGLAWVRLLRAQPQFADRCPWEKLDGRDWALLLRSQPQFADRCPWNKLKGSHWAQLLCKQPQFADRCPWEKLDGDAWATLLGSRPQIADRCPWEKLDGNAWAMLLCSQPKFERRCPWDILNSDDWVELLCSQPQFANRCPWDKLDGNDWASLLSNFGGRHSRRSSRQSGPQRQFTDRCPWDKLEGSHWALLLSVQPQFANKCPWDKLDGSDWAQLLCEQPQFADRCQWDKLGVYGWFRLLGKSPQFADRCPWDKFDGINWVRLLSGISGRVAQPEFADRCPWDKLDGRQWALLLRGQPQFADHCSWDKLDGSDWAFLFARGNRMGVDRLQFADKCDWSKLAGDDWVRLLVDHPQFNDRCDWSKLSDEDWDRLLEAQPQFADKRGK